MSDPEFHAADDRNIVLTGFMGTGKTTTGRIVARRLGYDFVDTDAIIEERHGPIPEIFADLGEARFRAVEQDLALELGDLRRTVIATGGRMLLDPANAAALSAHGVVICLTAPVDEIVDRVTSQSPALERPLLSGGDPRSRIAELLAERAGGYARFAQVDTGGRHPTDVATEVVRLSGLG